MSDEPSEPEAYKRTSRQITDKVASMSLFDLNIETMLEHWEIEHGLRELIANALDESILSGTAPISILKDRNGLWHIRDYGRGIRIDHFTLNENQEKSGKEGIIGKFGVGLKDALAALDRHCARVILRSQHGTFTLTKAAKHNFDGITTLHIAYEPADPSMWGTDVVLSDIPDASIEKAKGMFLRFREHRVLESTPYGQVIAAPSEGANVFVNGVWVNTEPTFLFSYNVTSLTEAMRKALNRERVNVGRSVYADRIRQILKLSNSPLVLQPLATAYGRRDEGALPEELAWIDIAHKALNELAQKQKVIVISHTEIKSNPELIEDIKRDGRQIVLITDKEKQKADQQTALGTAPFQTLRTWINSVNDSFQYQFVDEPQLTQAERKIWRLRYEVLKLVGLHQKDIPDIRISQTMHASEDNTNGVWDHDLKAIIIKRSQLCSLAPFAGTLLHECAHAVSGENDCTRQFENVLTDYLGRVSINALISVNPSIEECCEVLKPIDISGMWQMEEEYVGGRTSVLAELFQAGNDVRGVLIITDSTEWGIGFVLEECVKGIVDGQKIRLDGISYKVISGKPGQYNLDAWEGCILDHATIEGVSVDTQSVHGTFTMRRCVSEQTKASRQQP